MPIPIIIGVTGHRELRENDLPQLSKLIRAELQKLKADHPCSSLVMLNSLAAGADLLCAELAAELGIALKCPLPMSVEEYRIDFDAHTVARFDAMLAYADEVFIAPNTETLPDTLSRDYHYRQAGIYVATHSHVLLALWDGQAAVSGGCGSAEAVEFMLRGGYEGSSLKTSCDGAVIHIMTPRKGNDTKSPVTAKLIENEPGSLREVLRITDDFNRNSASITSVQLNDNELLPDKYSSSSAVLKDLGSVYNKANALSLHFQKIYLRAMGCFSVFAMLMVLSFLLYDELESDVFLLCYGLFIIIYLSAFVIVKRSKAHMYYLQYRMLSEAMRVQFYLTSVGSNENIGNSFTWTQKHDTAWIKQAVSAMLIGAPTAPDIPESIIKEYWIDNQLHYHQKAHRRDSRKHRTSEVAAKGMLIASIALFVIVLALEFLFRPTITSHIITKPLPGFFMQHDEQLFTLRSLMKIILGGISAATVFLSSYYGKLSFERKSLDHEKMALLYASAKERFESRQINSKRLFFELAREEIIENGNWFSYCRENSPSFNA